MPRKIEISHKTIVFAVVLLLILWFLYFIRDVILSIFVAVLIMVILNPLVARLAKFKIPRALSILIVYFLFIGIVAFSLAAVFPPLIAETTSFVNSLPDYIANISILGASGAELSQQLSSQFAGFSGEIVKVGVSVFSNLISVLTVLIIAFYLLLARDKMEEVLVNILDSERSKRVLAFMEKLEIKLGSWARGQIILILTVGLANYIGFLVLGIPFALPLAILAGILEMVPTLGPIFAAVPAVLVGLGISPAAGIAVAILAFLIQQVENYVLVPKIMQKSVGLNPVITLIALIVGFKIAGVAGAMLCMPIVVSLQVALKEYFG